MFNEIVLIKSLLAWASYVRSKLIYGHLNEEDKVRECYSCLKMMIWTNSHVGFFNKKKKNVVKHVYLNDSIDI